MNYLFFLPLALLVIITPALAYADTYGYTSGTSRWITDNAAGAGAACGKTGLTQGGATLYIQKRDSTVALQNCDLVTTYWDITSIPHWATITSVQIRYDITVAVPGTTCKFTSIEGTASTDALITAWNDADGTDGTTTTFVGSDQGCQTITNDKILSLGSSAVTDLQNEIANSTDYEWGLGFLFNNMTRIAGVTQNVQGANMELQVNYTRSPDPVTPLTALTTGSDFVIIDWTEPNLYGGTLSYYQINDTTPWGNPQTDLLSHSTSSVATVAGLTNNTQYSFRVAAVTNYGANASGYILNITTANSTTFVPINFTVGALDLSGVNTEIIPIQFERQDISSTSLFLNVTYKNTFTMNCNLQYKFANTNKTYASLAGTPVSSSRDEYSFLFTGIQNEIVGVKCWDVPTNTTANTVITQSDYPIVQEIKNFRNGTYGTMGQFGALDMITLFVVFFAMIGMNRQTDFVGVIFAVAIMGALSVTGVVGIITWPTVIGGFIVISAILAIGKLRGD